VQLDSIAEPTSRFAEHLRALVDADDSTPAALEELSRHRPGSGSDIEHNGVSICLDSRDEELPPARVLPEGQQRGVPVIRRAEWRKELAGGDDHATILARVAEPEEVARVAAIATAHADADETVSGVVPAQPAQGSVVYLCSYDDGRSRSWLVVDSEGRPLADRAAVREVVSLAALCELAEDAAGGGDVPELRRRLRELRLTEAPEGIEEAERAAEALEEAIAPAPRVASAGYLDAVGAAARRLEQALGETGGSPFAAAMQAAAGAAEALAADVLANYKVPLR
jgi:hypothetical protein